jgi:hypothetical protein
MNGITDHGRFGRRFRRWVGCALALGCAPGLSFSFSGTLSAPEYQAVSDIAGQVIRDAQASSRFTNGLRSLATTVEVAGVARSLAMGRVTVAVAATAGVALAAYCYTHGAACTQYGSDLASYWNKASPLAYNPDAQDWEKDGPPTTQYVWQSTINGTLYQSGTADGICSAVLPGLNAALGNRYAVYVSYTVTQSVHPMRISCKYNTYYTSNGAAAGVASQGAQEVSVQVASRLPASLSDLQTFVDAEPLTDPVLNDWPQELPIPVNAPQVKPTVVALGDPYAGPDPATGWRQDYAQVDPKPAPAPWYDVNVTTGTGVVDNPDTTNVEGPKTVDTVDPTTNDQTKPQTTETKDPGLCDMYPGILACQKLGDVPNDQVPKKTVNVTYSPESVDLPSGCPDDIDMGGGNKFSYATTCSNVSKAKPLILALASFAALTLVIAVIRRG